MYDPLFRLCLLRTRPPGVPIPARGSARCEDDYAGPGARRVRAPHASRRRFPPVEVFGIPGRDHVGRKEVRLLDVRSKFGGDHSQRGRFQGVGNGALESTREGREEEAHQDREPATCAESETIVRSESETERDNLADYRGSPL